MLFFCIRDDDTNYFTAPESLEKAYSTIWERGPVSLSVVPFHKGCQSKGIPDEYRTTGEIYPLEDNRDLVLYLRQLLDKKRIEVMLHGYHHEDFPNGPEFVAGADLARKVSAGKEYLEKLLETEVRVFVPPHNSISRAGLKAVMSSGLHLGMLAGLRKAWPLTSWHSWNNWRRIRQWTGRTGLSYPWIVDMGNHFEVAAHSVTPSSDLAQLHKELMQAKDVNGIFCLATHYWEYDVDNNPQGILTVREQVRSLLKTVESLKAVNWIIVGEALCGI